MLSQFQPLEISNMCTLVNCSSWCPSSADHIDSKSTNTSFEKGTAPNSLIKSTTLKNSARNKMNLILRISLVAARSPFFCFYQCQMKNICSTFFILRHILFCSTSAAWLKLTNDTKWKGSKKVLCFLSSSTCLLLFILSSTWFCFLDWSLTWIQGLLYRNFTDISQVARM